MPVSLSVCIITRNDATLISRCLTSVRSISDDIIVVDTGSTDETVAEALRLGARVERFAWCDDFSAARNYALGFARGEWILVLDTDETLAPAQETILHHLTGQSGVHGFRCQIRNALPGGNEFISQVTRLFRNDPRIRFSGRVHEQVEPALQKLGKQAPACDLTIVHTGYGVDEATNRAKAERNLKGLLLDFDETPSNLFLAIKIGQLYLTCGDPDRALEYLSRGVGVGDPALAAEGYNGIAGIRAGRGEFESALRACAESIARAQYQRMAYVLVSQILHAMGRHQDAESQLAIARSMRGPSQLHADLPIIGG